MKVMNKVTSVQSSEIGELIAGYSDMKQHLDNINTTMKQISEIFKETSDELINRNQPYIVNHNGRSLSFVIERVSRSTLDSKALAAECVAHGIDTTPFKRTAQVQSFVVREHKMIE